MHKGSMIIGGVCKKSRYKLKNCLQAINLNNYAVLIVMMGYRFSKIKNISRQDTVLYSEVGKRKYLVTGSYVY